MTANRSKIAFVSENFRLFLKILQMSNIKTTIGVCRELIQENKNLHVLENFTVVILATSKFLLNDRKAVKNDISLLKFSIIFENFANV